MVNDKDKKCPLMNGGTVGMSNQNRKKVDIYLP